jgi:hypothetical protein
MSLIKLLWKISLIYALFVTPLWADNIKCLDTVNQINKDYETYNEVASQHLDWMNLSWLESNLGNPEIRKNIFNQTEYKWQCNPSTSITANINPDTKKIDSLATAVEVNSVTSGLTINFINSTATSYKVGLPSKVTSEKVSASPTPVETHSTNAVKGPSSIVVTSHPPSTAIPSYNKKFGTSVNTVNELEIDMTKRTKDYAEKLLSCTPGNYQYAYVMGDVIYVTSTIKGKQGDHCLMESSYPLGNATISSVCQIPNQELPGATKEILELVKTEQTVSPETVKNASEKSVFEKNCTVNITGLRAE